MANFENGEKVSWVEEMVCVPHPDGKTDRKGNVLPVFRDKTTTGTVINSLYDIRSADSSVSVYSVIYVKGLTITEVSVSLYSIICVNRLI